MATVLRRTPLGLLPPKGFDKFVQGCFEDQSVADKTVIRLRYGSDLTAWYVEWSTGRFNTKERFFEDKIKMSGDDDNGQREGGK